MLGHKKFFIYLLTYDMLTFNNLRTKCECQGNIFIPSMDRKFSLQVRLGEDIEKMAVRLGDVALLPGVSEFELLFCHVLAI